MHKSKKKVMALNNLHDKLFLILPIFLACMCVLTEGLQGQGYAGKYLELRGGEGTVGWVKLHNEEFNFLCFMAYNVGGVKIIDGDMGEACGTHGREEEFVQCSGLKT